MITVIKKKIIQYRILLITLFSLLQACQRQNACNYKYPNCNGIAIMTGIYLDSTKVGEIKTIDVDAADVDAANNICSGKIHFHHHFQLNQNMEFYHEESLIDDAEIRIRINKSLGSLVLDPPKDTIIIKRG